MRLLRWSTRRPRSPAAHMAQDDLFAVVLHLTARRLTGRAGGAGLSPGLGWDLSKGMERPSGRRRGTGRFRPEPLPGQSVLEPCQETAALSTASLLTACRVGGAGRGARSARRGRAGQRVGGPRIRRRVRRARSGGMEAVTPVGAQGSMAWVVRQTGGVEGSRVRPRGGGRGGHTLTIRPLARRAARR
jgi:hypothetical protein